MTSACKVSVRGGGAYIPNNQSSHFILPHNMMKSAQSILSQTMPTAPSSIKITAPKGDPSYTETQLTSVDVPGNAFDILMERSNSRTITSLSNQAIAVLQELTKIEIWKDDKLELTITSPEDISTLCSGGMNETDKTPLLASGATLGTDPEASSGMLRIWNALTGTQIANCSFPDPIYSIVYLENSIIALSFLNKGEIVIWDCVKMEKISACDTGQTSLSSLNGMDNQRLACGFNSGVVQVWEWNKPEVVFTTSLNSSINCICELNPKTILVGANSGWIISCDLTKPNSGTDVYQASSLLALQRIDSNHIVLGAFMNAIRILNTDTWVTSWTGYTASPYGFSSPSPDGTFLFCSANYEEPAINRLIKCSPLQSDPLACLMKIFEKAIGGAKNLRKT